MKQHSYIKLNDTDDYLSLGNFFRIIKEESNCKNTFLQSELFCSLFDIDSIADSTVNNYLTGFRTINSIYKEKMITKKNNFQKDKLTILPTFKKIISVLENRVISYINITDINSNLKLYNVCNRLYNISKNDLDVPKAFTLSLGEFINNNNLFEFITNVLFYVVLDKNQPVSFENKLMKSINDTLKYTNISPNQITDFINTQLEESMWSSLGKIVKLSKEDNAFACLQMAFYEFYGLITGYPRYIKSYSYYKIAAEQNHPAANWAIGHMYYNGYIGNKTQDDFKLAMEYFEKAKELGSAAAINSIGLVYLEGKLSTIPKDRKKAIELFNIAVSKGNVFALNNLGRIYEEDKNYLEAIKCFESAAENGECWAANKVGEYYRKGEFVDKDIKKAFYYYNKSDESSIYFMCPWAKYNLAKYFYLTGNAELNIEIDINHAIELFENASSKILEANEELIYIYYKKYLDGFKEDSSLLDKVKFYISRLESFAGFNKDVKDRVEKIMHEIYDDKNSIKFKF